MNRTRIQLDKATCEAVRRRAFGEGRPMASVARETVAKTFGTATPEGRKTITDFSFVGIGSDPNPPGGAPVSVDHDRWYVTCLGGNHGEHR